MQGESPMQATENLLGNALWRFPVLLEATETVLPLLFF
jgi:hypothetical protein